VSDAQQIAEEIASRCAEFMWADDAASQALGMDLIDIGPGRATIAMTVRDDMVNGHAIGHGGFTFTLADSAFAFACNSYNRRTVAQSCSISYLAPTRLGQVLIAEATERLRTGRSGIYDITVRAGEQVVAEFRGHSREIGGTFFEEGP